MLKQFILIASLISFSYQEVSATIQPVANPEAVSYYNRAMAEFNYNNMSEAIKLMTKAIELKPDYPEALANRGYFYYLGGQNELAILDYEVAEKLKKNSVGYLIACPFALTGKKDEAFKYLETFLSGDDKPLMSTITGEANLKSLHSDPRWKTLITKDWYSPYEKLIQEANKKLNEKDLQGSIDILTKAIALDPAKDVAYGSRGLNYIYLGSFDKALADLNEAIKLKPTSVYYGNRAYTFKQMKKQTEALNDYDKALELDPQNMVYGDRATLRYIMNQKDPRVESDLKIYLESFYKDDYYHFVLGSYYYGSGRDNEAISALSKAITINKQAGYFIKRGNAYFGKKQFAEATNDFNEAINLDPKNGEAYYLRGVVKGEQRDKSGACTDWKKAANLGYQDPNGYIKAICN